MKQEVYRSGSGGSRGGGDVMCSVPLKEVHKLLVATV